MSLKTEGSAANFEMFRESEREIVRIRRNIEQKRGLTGRLKGREGPWRASRRKGRVPKDRSEKFVQRCESKKKKNNKGYKPTQGGKPYEMKRERGREKRTSCLPGQGGRHREEKPKRGREEKGR